MQRLVEAQAGAKAPGTPPSQYNFSKSSGGGEEPPETSTTLGEACRIIFFQTAKQEAENLAHQGSPQNAAVENPGSSAVPEGSRTQEPPTSQEEGANVVKAQPP